MPKATSEIPANHTRCSIPNGEENQACKAVNSEIRVEKSSIKNNEGHSRRECTPHEQLYMCHNQPVLLSLVSAVRFKILV
jgi:hypothetical protein